MNPHIMELVRANQSLDVCAQDIQQAFELLRDCCGQGGKILLCGNGGSAADCEHWSGELLKGFLSRRPLDQAWRAKLGEDLADKLQGALPAIPLTGFSSFSTAYGNDMDPAYGFAQLVWALGRPGDVLVAISTSGNSRNVNHAARTAVAKGMKTLALTGGSGGELAGLANVCICVPGKKVHLIQQLHLPVYHCLCLMLEEEFFGMDGEKN